MAYNEDGNLIGRAGALLVIALAAWGVHKISCATDSCPVMESSCCTGEKPAAK